jgi:hypothetical protein
VARRALAAVLAAALATACAHVTTNEQDATIWLDGRPVGRSGLVWALGPPHTARVVVVARDGRRAHAVVSRELTGDALQGGLYTLGICFLFCWTYPDTFVALPAPRPRTGSWDEDGWDALWMTAPGATPTPTPTSTSTSTATPTATPTALRP